MRLATVLALMLVAALPSAALGATQVPWPSAKDITAAEPGVGAKAAGCMATFYRGRLSRDAWLTPWWKLTRAEKLVTDAAYSRCLNRAERIAAIERPVTALVGAHPEVACAARGIDALSLRVRLAFTTRAKQRAAYDRIARRCRLMGVLYQRTASETQLTLTPAEQACANAQGTLDPVMHRKGAVIAKAYLEEVGRVFDACVGAKSEEAMYRSILVKYKVTRNISCIAHRAAATITFVQLVGGDPSVRTRAARATEACLLAQSG
jgi:hypothetical protein